MRARRDLANDSQGDCKAQLLAHSDRWAVWPSVEPASFAGNRAGLPAYQSLGTCMTAIPRVAGKFESPGAFLAVKELAPGCNLSRIHLIGLNLSGRRGVL